MDALPAAPSNRLSGGRRPSTSLALTIERWSRIWIAFIAILVVLAALIVGNETYFEPRVRNAVEVALHVRDTHEALLDQETSLRGYLLTGNARFLQPYERAKVRLAALGDDARGLPSVPGTADLLLEFRVRQTAWVEGWGAAALRSGALGDVADRNAHVIEGKRLFDSYRLAYDALTARLFDARERAVDAQSSAIAAAAGAAAFVTVISAGFMLWQGRVLRRSVGPPLDVLLDQLAAMRAGDFSPRASFPGPEELQRIGAGLDETSNALALARDAAATHAEQILTHSRQLGQVLRLAREVAGSLNLQYVLRGVCEATSAIADGRRVVVWLRSEDDSTVEPRADSAGPGLEPVGLEPVELGDGAVGRAARYGRVQGHVGDVVDSNGGDDDDELAVPMIVGAEVIGVLVICGPGASTLPTTTLDVLEALAVQAASAIGSARLLERTESLAMTDALTRLPNRRQLETDLATEVGVSVRYDRPLAFAMIDVDHFKAYNDTLGHQAADVALQELARLLSAGARAGDTVYRYGGEEIAIILRETTAKDARELAERLRATVEHHFAAPSQPRGVTVSAGVASIPDHGQTGRELVAAADRALYDAKRAGRNQVVVAPSQPTGQMSRQ